MEFLKHIVNDIVPLTYFCTFYSCVIFVSLNESRGYLGFSIVTPSPPQRFLLEKINLKNILVRPLKFGMWVYMGNATNAIVL